MRVLAALSGGVDSSVAAALLHEDGHEVVAVTMKLWGGESDTGCCSVSEVEDARRAAAQLNLDHHVFNFGEEFEKHVVAPYVADHAAGRTPNPCRTARLRSRSYWSSRPNCDAARRIPTHCAWGGHGQGSVICVVHIDGQGTRQRDVPDR